MKVIGLTGGIGSGKSTVAKLLAELGAAVVDADKTGHEVLYNDRPVIAKVVSEFGSSVLKNDGSINRSRLGKMVFDDPENLRRLNSLLHPIIYEKVGEKLEAYRRQGVAVAVLESALLLEVGTGQVDEVWVTVAPAETVVRRIIARDGLPKEEVLARIRAQLPAEEMVKRADVIIDTDGSIEQLRSRVRDLFDKVRA